jgi:hypothetical protein
MAAIAAAITRLQIDRTQEPLRLGQLANVSPAMDGTGVSDGQIPVYDKASGTYKAGTGGLSYPTLAYDSNHYLANTGPFVVNLANPPAGNANAPIWSVSTSGNGWLGTLGMTWHGCVYNRDGAGAQLGFPGATARVTMNSGFVSGQTDAVILNLGMQVSSNAGGQHVSTNAPTYTQGIVCDLPYITTCFYSSGTISYYVVVIVVSLDGNDSLYAIAPAVTLGPAVQYQTRYYDFTGYVTITGTDLTFANAGSNYIQCASGKPYQVILLMEASPSGVTP